MLHWAAVTPEGIKEPPPLAQTFRFEGCITPEQVRREPYIYLPFNVPAGARRIDVSYQYNDPVNAPLGMGPGNSIDIGIFDSRGNDFLTAQGFRGWSGAARPSFFIAADEATPGYLRGPLFPGEWTILLGAYRVNPDGARYTVEVRLEVGRAEAVAERALPAVSGGAAIAARARGRPRWVKGDLHTHTLHSDGLNTVDEMVRHAAEKGLDFLAVTDHNTVTHFEDLDRLAADPATPVTLIPGEEITTYWGHANAWGLREWIDFRCADEESIAAVRDYVLARGGLISINHAKCMGPPWLFRGWEGYPAMEVWQAPWRFHNWESLDQWERLLRAGRRVVAVGGSDTHSIPPAPPRHPHGLAEPTTYVFAEDGGSAEGVLAGIRAGHVFITDSPQGPRLYLYADAEPIGAKGGEAAESAGAGRRRRAMMGDAVASPDGRPVRFRAEVHGGAGRRLWLLTEAGPLDIIPLEKDDAAIEFALDVTRHRYVRAELRGFRGRPERGEVVWAMTNPVWFAQA